ncbi:hypothetical protein J2S74_002357 [Evansella vedderi]|uniref:NERD domain-containing protein n=1 Tax=Evansella vedderi TaxID=38282 RepID=A0ABT9ZVK1_9BACI|nr:NERD domain-containing protein [Evansella vedderi]MDQ0254975.1 hypothetical protein [Evansella vedderi]
MAQLVKLSNYISRYETDIYRYPSHFVRLKKERWGNLVQEWNSRQKIDSLQSKFCADETEVKSKFKGKFKKWFSGSKDLDTWEEDPPREKFLPKSQLHEAFMEEIFHFQLNWASSTFSEISHLNNKYYNDSLLSHLLKELPDSFFIFYEPVFVLRKASVDLDIIILTPSEVWLLTPLTGNNHNIFHSHSERFWIKRDGENQEKVIHPFVSLKRMVTVIKEILVECELDIPIRMGVIAKDSFIDINASQQRVKLIDKRTFQDWQRTLKKIVTPIKHQQLKAANILLRNCKTNSEWRDSMGTENGTIEGSERKH